MHDPRDPHDPGGPVPGRPTLDLTRPFLRQKGLSCGLTKHRLDGPAFTSIFGSVRIDAGSEVTTERRAEAALLVLPTAWVSHHTAAVLWGGVVPHTTVTHVSVSTPRERRGRQALTCHVHARQRTTTLRGLRVTTPSQTFCDLAEDLDLVDLVVLGDSLVHKGVVPVDDLLAHAHELRGGGAARARRAAYLVRPGAESPMETRVRLMLVLAGLPEPVVQHVVGDDRTSYRLDLAWPELRIALEHDGRQHAEDSRQWGRDLGRREWLDGRGWRLIVMRAEDVYDPWAAIGRVVAALAGRGYERTTLLPPAAFVEHGQWITIVRTPRRHRPPALT